MTRSVRSCVCLIIAWVATTAAVAAAADREAFDRRLTAQLEALSPESVPVWVAANAARERGQHQRAAELYARVARQAPSFTPAARRQAGEELQLGHRSTALALMRAAVAAEPSAENLATLALCLSDAPDGESPSRGDLQEAVASAKRAADLAPGDEWVNDVLCQVALRAEDVEALRRGVDRLLLVAPEEPATHQFAALLAAVEGRSEAAAASLRKARELGLPEERYVALSRALEGSRSPLARWLPRLAWFVGIWVGALALLLLVGAVLSHAVLGEAEALSRDRLGRAGHQSPFLRRAYAVVLWASCAYYYVSLPIVVLLLVALGGGLIYGLLATGHLPVKLLILVVVITLATLWAVLKGLFVRGRDEDPGPRLDLRSEPRLRALLEEVARRIGTRMVDNVYLTPATELAVMERGGLGRQLRGGAERCLILGIGILGGLTIGPFKAVLAHEYGHFSNRDTAGGGFALAVRRSLLTTPEALAASGAAAWYNPAWLFLKGFYRVFLRISHGASRLQEILADRGAALAYGSKGFEDGLRHVIERSVRFDVHANLTLNEMIKQRQPVTNLYTHQPVTTIPEEEVARAIRESLNRPSSAYDSHPSPLERSRWVRALAAKGTPAPDDGEEVWTLFSDREAIELGMTRAIQAAVS